RKVETLGEYKDCLALLSWHIFFEKELCEAMSGCACKSQERAIPYDKLEAIVEKYKGDPSAIIPILQDVQDLLGCVPKESISFIAEKLGVSAAKIYGIVTFYAQFRLTPRGKYTIMICEGTACHVNGA